MRQLSQAIEQQNKGESEELLIAADRLASMMNLSTRSIWRLLSAGRLVKPVRLNGAVRWRRKEVEQWIDAGCPSPEESNGKRV